MMRILLFVIIAAVMLAGCSNGVRQGQLTVLPDGTVVHSGSAFGIMNPADASPTELANAKLTYALADNIKNSGKANNASLAGGYVGVVCNMESKFIAHLADPEKSVSYTIPPGGFQFLQTNNVPEYIYVKYPGQRMFTKTRIFKNPGVYNGVKYDYGVRINKKY